MHAVYTLYAVISTYLMYIKQLVTVIIFISAPFALCTIALLSYCLQMLLLLFIYIHIYIYIYRERER